MYNWFYKRILIALILSSVSLSVFSDIRCALEFDGVAGFSESELPVCLQADDASDLCPLQALACNVFPPITTTETIVTQGSCTPVGGQGLNICSINARSYPTHTSCLNSCNRTETTTTTTIQPPVCPSGNQYGCHEVDGTPMCSPNQCFDSDTVSNATDLTTEAQSNDAFNSNGECTGEVQFFPGVRTGCRLGGYQTRWDNCCNNGNKVITDSFSNSIEQGFNIIDAVSGIVDSVLGTSTTSIAAETERALELSGAYISTELSTQVMNWAVTPCSDDSLSVAVIASDYCYQVGIKCIEDWEFVGCVQRAEVHCCFNSLMARIVHEQGRPQLPAFGWGSADTPNCKGFTSTEFQALDFSKFDFTEYETEIRHSSSQELQIQSDDALQNATNNFGGTP